MLKMECTNTNGVVVDVEGEQTETDAWLGDVEGGSLDNEEELLDDDGDEPLEVEGELLNVDEVEVLAAAVKVLGTVDDEVEEVWEMVGAALRVVGESDDDVVLGAAAVLDEAAVLEEAVVLLEDKDPLEVCGVLDEEDEGAGGLRDELGATDADEEVEVPDVLSPDAMPFLYMSSLSPAPQYSY
jgi:hypothetical protein